MDPGAAALRPPSAAPCSHRDAAERSELVASHHLPHPAARQRRIQVHPSSVRRWPPPLRAETPPHAQSGQLRTASTLAGQAPLPV
ncbi:hypothetical protein ACP70R_046414 [Stipagrostis hirtigluma subsp. patula]